MDEPAIGLGGSSVASLARLHGADTTVAEVIGSELYLVAQAARLIRKDADAQLHEPRSAYELAEMLEETRERCAIACTLLDLALERIGGVDDYTMSPRDKAAKAMRRPA